MKPFDRISLWVSKENISRNSLITSILINCIISIMAVSLFSPIIKQHEKIVGQYYSIMTIIPIVVTILITWFYSSAYKRKEELMAHRAIEAKTKNKELQDIQNKIRDKMYDQPILDYINEFNEK